ncbi:hypothetical protein R0L47_19170 [Pectobacterium polonicum]|uniref:hypothetical protein n=1 Tax=Pectobacterium polonicum TaxID=2485124 RepID=UPI0037547418
MVGSQLTQEYDFAGLRRTARREDGLVALWELDGNDHVVRFTDYDGRVTYASGYSAGMQRMRTPSRTFISMMMPDNWCVGHMPTPCFTTSTVTEGNWFR